MFLFSVQKPQPSSQGPCVCLTAVDSCLRALELLPLVWFCHKASLPSTSGPLFRLFPLPANKLFLFFLTYSTLLNLRASGKPSPTPEWSLSIPELFLVGTYHSLNLRTPTHTCTPAYAYD